MKRTYTISLPAWPLTAWILMLTLGGIHSEAPSIPALGYVVCLGIATTVAFLRGSLSSDSESLAHYRWERR